MVAIEKYRENGRGITFQDIMKEYSVNKAKAQRTLKYFHERGVLFTSKDITLEAPGILENRSPQRQLQYTLRRSLCNICYKIAQ